MQIDLRLNIARLLARIQKHLREFDAEVDVVRAAGPLPPVGHLLAQLFVRNDFVGVESVGAFEILVDDEATVDDVVEEFSLLQLETLPQRLGETLAVRVGIATARQQSSLTASPRNVMHHAGRRNRMQKGALSIAYKKSSTSIEFPFDNILSKFPNIPSDK